MDQFVADQILGAYDEITSVFGSFQKQTGLNCREHCGKCCITKDIYCSPLEMLPLGLKLIADKKAEEYLDLCLTDTEDKCVLLKITDKEKGSAFCTQYNYRPFVCRTFAVAPRKNKNGAPDFSICKILREDHASRVDSLLKTQFPEAELPFIEQWRKNFDAIDPRLLEEQLPIRKSLAVILEKLLFIESLKA